MQDTTPTRLTRRSVAALPAPRGSAVIHRDDEVPGLGLRVAPSGRKTWVLRYRTRLGAARLLTLGRAEVIAPEAARVEALRLLGEVATGKDPARERQEARAEPTFAELRAVFLDWVRTRRKRNTQAAYASTMRTHLAPAFDRLRLSEVTGERVTRLHASLAATPGAANLALAVLQSAWDFAQRQGMVAECPRPWEGIERYPKGRRRRRLSGPELRRLWPALDEFRTELPHFAPFIRVLLLTGARLSEWRDALWSWVDLDAGLLRLPDSKTGAKNVTIPAPAAAILRAMPRTSIYVFPGVKGGPANGIQYVWARFRRLHGFEGVNLHDLRRTAGSIAIEAGLSIVEVAAILGHASPRTTEIYLATDEERMNANAGKTAAAVIQLATGTRPAAVPKPNAPSHARKTNRA